MDATSIMRAALEQIAGEPSIRRNEHANSFSWADLAAKNCLIARTALARAASTQPPQPDGCDHETFNYCWNCKTTREQRAAQPPGASE
jgi:hypothetical protein